MNSLKNIELQSRRSYQSNVVAQSRVLFDIIQKQIDINTSGVDNDCKLLLSNISLYEENVDLLRRKGIQVIKVDDGWTLTW